MSDNYARLAHRERDARFAYGEGHWLATSPAAFLPAGMHIDENRYISNAEAISDVLTIANRPNPSAHRLDHAPPPYLHIGLEMLRRALLQKYPAEATWREHLERSLAAAFR